MKRFVILLFLVSMMAAQSGRPGHPLTNDDFAKMVEQHITPAVIVKVIGFSSTHFNTNAEAMHSLKAAGTSLEVLDAITAAQSATHAQPPQGVGAQIEGVAKASKSSGACAADLASCKDTGCAAPGSDHAVFNRAKRRRPDISAQPVALKVPEDFEALQEAAETKVGSGGDIAGDSRAELVDIDTSGGKVGEGSLVRVFGFLTAKPAGLGPHPNTGESVNCKLRGEPNNDIHIPVVDQAGESEFQGIVVEMIPQDRNKNPGWDSKTLIAVAKKGFEVWIEGGLFYDNEHKVNDDQDNPLSGQPARMSLWEVHPITTFLVCSNPAGCSHKSKTGWKPLSAFKTKSHTHTQ